MVQGLLSQGSGLGRQGSEGIAGRPHLYLDSTVSHASGVRTALSSPSQIPCVLTEQTNHP